MEKEFFSGNEYHSSFGRLPVDWCLNCSFRIRLQGFKRELWYINMEIERSDEEEKLVWKKKKRKLLLSLIPFVRY